MRRLAAILLAAGVLAAGAGCSSGGSKSSGQAPAAGSVELEARVAELERQVTAQGDLEQRLKALENVATRLQSDQLRNSKRQSGGLKKLRTDFDKFVEDFDKAQKDAEKLRAEGQDPLTLVQNDVETLQKQLKRLGGTADEALRQAGESLAAVDGLQARVAALEAAATP